MGSAARHTGVTTATRTAGRLAAFALLCVACSVPLVNGGAQVAAPPYNSDTQGLARTFTCTRATIWGNPWTYMVKPRGPAYSCPPGYYRE